MIVDSEVLLISDQLEPRHVVPALALLPRPVRTCLFESSVSFLAGGYSLVVLDARGDPGRGQAVCARLAASRNTRVLAVVDRRCLQAVTETWPVDDVVFAEVGPAELDARLRLLSGRVCPPAGQAAPVHRVGALVIDESTQTARLRGRALGLSTREFSLLKILIQWPGRVFTRSELLRQVWGEVGATLRTVDVHIRRLRSKLGPEYAGLIVTVRKVGYQVVEPARGGLVGKPGGAPPPASA